MAAASTIVLIVVALLMGLGFLAALVAVLVFSSSRRGSWTPPPREPDGRDSPHL